MFYQALYCVAQFYLKSITGVDVGEEWTWKTKLNVYDNIEYSGKPSEGFSLFSAGNVLWLMSEQHTNSMQWEVIQQWRSICSQPALSAAAEGKSANNCSPYWSLALLLYLYISIFNE